MGIFRLLVPTVFAASMMAGFASAQGAGGDGPLKPVKILQTSPKALTVQRQFFGQAVARKTVDLAFQVSGQILEFPVTEGFVVPARQMVAELDLEPFELKLEQARLQKEQADRTVARLEKLEGTVSQVSIDDAITQAGLADVAVRDAEYALKHATLHAPFDALVSSREVEQFTTVSAGTPIVRLHDMSELHIKVDVPEVLFQSADESDQVEITAVFPGRDTIYPVEVHEFTAEASSVGQSYQVTFRMDPPEDREVLPGASVTVRVVIDLDDQAIILPSTAIVLDTTGNKGVMVFTPDAAGGDSGTVGWVPVTVSATQEGDFHVTSGLDGGEELVLTGGSALKNGQAVRRFGGFAN